MRISTGMLMGKLAYALPLLLMAAGCERNPFSPDPSSLIRRGEARACAHQEVIAMVRRLAMDSDDRMISKEEAEAISLRVDQSVMLEADLGVSVTCSVELTAAVDDKTWNGPFAFQLRPMADGSDNFEMRWDDRQHGLYTYNSALWYWKDAERKREAALERSLTPSAPQLVGSDSPVTSREPPPPPTDRTERTRQRTPSLMLPDLPEPRDPTMPASSSGDEAARIEPAEWLVKPIAEFPQAALDREASGYARIRCLARLSGRLTNCVTLSEQPRGVGFGEAAVQAAQTAGRVRPAMQDGKALDRALITTTVHFRLEGE